jgi:hypothetical protein
MKQQPDKLFRDKLENFQLNAPANTWSKIETGLDKSSRKGIWLKIAAGIAVFAAAGILLWTIPSENGYILATESADTQTESLALQSNQDVQESTPENPVVSMHTEPQQKQEQAKPTNKKIEAAQQNHTLLAQPTTSVEVKADLVAAIDVFPSAEAVAKLSSSDIGVTNEESQKSVYLVFTADEVNEKYLRQSSTVDATSDDKKTSRIQMLMSVANNLKNGDGGLTDLRQMKDEIFALNFLDDKNQQSKKN